MFGGFFGFDDRADWNIGDLGGPPSVATTGLLADKAVFHPSHSFMPTKVLNVEKQEKVPEKQTITRPDGTSFEHDGLKNITEANVCTKVRAKVLTGTLQMILEVTMGAAGANNKKLQLIVYDMIQIQSAKHIGNCVVEVEVGSSPKCYHTPSTKDGFETYKAKDLGKENGKSVVIADLTGNCGKITLHFEKKPKKNFSTKNAEEFAKYLDDQRRNGAQNKEEKKRAARERKLDREWEEEYAWERFRRDPWGIGACYSDDESSYFDSEDDDFFFGLGNNRSTSSTMKSAPVMKRAPAMKKPAAKKGASSSSSSKATSSSSAVVPPEEVLELPRPAKRQRLDDAKGSVDETSAIQKCEELITSRVVVGCKVKKDCLIRFSVDQGVEDSVARRTIQSLIAEGTFVDCPNRSGSLKRVA